MLIVSRFTFDVIEIIINCHFSVFSDEDWRSKLFTHLPLIKVKKMKKNPKILNTISGPCEIQYSIEILIQLFVEDQFPLIHIFQAFYQSSWLNTAK